MIVRDLQERKQAFSLTRDGLDSVLDDLDLTSSGDSDGEDDHAVDSNRRQQSDHPSSAGPSDLVQTQADEVSPSVSDKSRTRVPRKIKRKVSP